MRIKPWMWFAGAVGAFILLKDDVANALNLSNSFKVVPGKNYQLIGTMPAGLLVAPKMGEVDNMRFLITPTGLSTWTAIISPNVSKTFTLNAPFDEHGLFLVLVREL